MNKTKLFLIYSLIFSISLIFCSTNLFSQKLDKYDEDILKAMRDEIKISLNELKLESLKSPYYVEYELVISEPISLKSINGSFVEKAENKSIILNVGLRVGDYKFDNTNFFDVGLSFFGSSDDEERFKRRNLPIELNYDLLRRELWLATDAAYKQNSEIYSKKESSLKNRMRKDTLVDFLPIKINKIYNKSIFPNLDTLYFREVLNAATNVFKTYQEIHTNSGSLEFSRKTKYYVNSEGVEFIKSEYYTGLEIVAFCQSKDGMPISNFYSAYSKDPKNLPSKDSIVNATILIAENIKLSTGLTPIDDSYSGPIWFEGQAAAEMIAYNFAPNLVTQRALMTESGTQEIERNGAFQNKIGAKVLPEFLTLYDLPKENKVNDVDVVGTFEIDEDGLETEKLTLVKNGYLKTLIAGRVPTKKISGSNARKRGGSPIYSNLVLKSEEIMSNESNIISKPKSKSKNKSKVDKITESKISNNNILSDSELKDKMINLCKDRKLDFGIIIKKIHNQNIFSTTLYSAAMGGVDFIRGDGNFGIVEAYKIYPDGREELVRGLKGFGFSPSSFKDIIYVGEKSYTYNLLTPTIISNFITGGEQYLTASITTPSLFFEDGELRLIETDYKKPPIMKKPSLN